MQKDAKIPNAPEMRLPTPSEYYLDCIHPNGKGWAVISETFYQNYWKNVLSSSKDKKTQ